MLNKVQYFGYENVNKGFVSIRTVGHLLFINIEKLLNVCLHNKSILLTTPHVVHKSDSIIGHKLNCIYKFIMKTTTIRREINCLQNEGGAKKLFAKTTAPKKNVCVDEMSNSSIQIHTINTHRFSITVSSSIIIWRAECL